MAQTVLRCWWTLNQKLREPRKATYDLAMLCHKTRANITLIHLYKLLFILLIASAVHRPNTLCPFSNHGLLAMDRS